MLIELLMLLLIASTAAAHPSPLDDSFDGTGQLDAKWITYNAAATPDVQNRSGYFDALVVSDDSVWIANSRGRADCQEAEFPAGPEPKTYFAYNIGVGPQDDPQANLPVSNKFVSYAGLLVTNDVGFSPTNYMFAFLGNRGSKPATLELKSDENGVSTGYVTDEGSNALGVGVTHGNEKVELHSNGDVKFAYQLLNTEVWIYIDGGTGFTPGSSPGSPRPNLGAAGDPAYVCIVGAGFRFEGETPFRATVDRFEAIDNHIHPVPGLGPGAENSPMASLVLASLMIGAGLICLRTDGVSRLPSRTTETDGTAPLREIPGSTDF
jgi:hypothetical protein